MPARACPRPSSRSSLARPGMTRTQMLRAAQTSAVVQKEPAPAPRQAAAAATRSRTGLAKVGPPPACPRKVDFAAPGMTKAMQMRQKAAAEKVRQIEERQKKLEPRRCPRRTPAPVGGDARLGRAKSPPRKAPEQAIQELEEAIHRGHVSDRKKTHEAALGRAVARGHIRTTRGPPPRPKRAVPGPSGVRKCPTPLASGTMVPDDTKELARLMNADVVQAVPISDGPVNKIIIDPGVVCPNRSTIVSIANPDATDAGSEIANKSIQAINESLDEQDAIESATVQNKLEELQNARREFVIAVANVGGNSVNLQDDSGDSILDIDELGPPMEYIPSPPRERQRVIYKIPDISHVMFQVQYGRDHPDVEAARRFSKKAQVTLDEYATQKRIEDEFERMATSTIQEINFEIPLEQELQEADLSFEEDDYGTVIPCPSRVKASMRVPQKTEACPYRGANIDEIERFFNVQDYPPELSQGPRAPPGREDLNPDLWDFEDIWYHEKTVDDGPPLMRFDSPC